MRAPCLSGERCDTAPASASSAIPRPSSRPCQPYTFQLSEKTLRAHSQNLPSFMAFWSRSVRSIPKSSLFAAAICLSSGCAGNTLKTRQLSHADFWGALAELNPDKAVAYAQTPSQKLFAESLRHLMGGDITAAERGFANLQASADDS